MRVPVGDIDLHVRELGSGRPLILLHGGPGLDGSVFFPALAPLADEHRLLAVDLRANGRSGAGDPSTWTLPQLADDIEALIGALALDQPSVLGWSFGSFVAQEHMVRHGTAAAYVLCGTVAEPGALDAVETELARFEPIALREQVTRSWADEQHITKAEESRELMRAQLPFHFYDPEGPLVAVGQAAVDEIAFADPAVLRHFSAQPGYGMRDLRSQLASVQQSVLVLSGERDRTTATASAHELAELLPLGQEVVLPRTAHMMLVEDQVGAVGAIRTFLAGV